MPWPTLTEVLTTWLPFRYREGHYQVGPHVLRIRTPRFMTRIYDRTDPNQRNAAISEAAFPLAGIVWPCGEVLAHYLLDMDLAGRKVLEIGCGMGLASQLLGILKVDLTAMDIHPLVSEYLQMNARINRLKPPVFVEASWSDPSVNLGRFDLVIASDILYEPRHSDHLAGFIDRHAGAEVIIVDPDRGQANVFISEMQQRGFRWETDRPAFLDTLDLAYQVQIHRFFRSTDSDPDSVPA
ncbi:MAG: histidine kinase [Proteobacteria bacterium]|nr:histidine kinase [Pseudomonadota bacterium]